MRDILVCVCLEFGFEVCCCSGTDQACPYAICYWKRCVDVISIVDWMCRMAVKYGYDSDESIATSETLVYPPTELRPSGSDALSHPPFFL